VSSWVSSDIELRPLEDGAPNMGAGDKDVKKPNWLVVGQFE